MTTGKTVTGDVDAPWQSLTIAQTVDLFRAAVFPWWIAGGHAIELAVGRPVRDHGDVDVLILRRDHLAARALLAAWDCHAADPPGSLRPWPVGEPLPDDVHDVWCRETPDHPWQFQFMIDESDGDQVRFRRDPRVSRPIDGIGARTADGIPYLRPEIQLWYKGLGRRPKDDVDLAAMLPVLDEPARTWLRDAIVRSYGPDHPWLPDLMATGHDQED